MENTKSLVQDFRNNRDYKKFAQMAVKTEGTVENLLELCGTTDYPFPQYSSWLLAHIADYHTEILQKYQPAIIDALLSCTDPSAQRNLGNALLKFPKSNYREGELIDKLFQFLQNPDSKVALKAYSMYLVVGFLKDYPELKGEFKSILEAGFERESAAYRGAAKKSLKFISSI